MDDLNAKVLDLRKDIITMVYRAKAGHIGGDMSVVDALAVLYNRIMNVDPENQNDPDRDRFVLSKGHCVEALYAVLADRGFFEIGEVMDTLCQFGSRFIGHPHNKIPGIEMCSGSLGHGLPVAVGMALAGKLDGKNYRVYTIMGDGELAEGSVWEGAMSAGHYRLDNLCALIDRNRLQISGGTEEVMGQEDQKKRWESFGWHVIETEGNQVDALTAAYEEAALVKGKPTVIIADTTKGYGISYMENQTAWHHKVPTEEEWKQALEELEAKKEAVLHE